MMTNDTTEVMLEGSRFWFQKVLVPLMVCVGVTGNIITVMVLTRRRMRSSTNIYLSALAIADILHLFFVFLLSFKHYSNIHDRKYELYWRFYGLSHWLCDAASSTSVWLTVSFTVERYIAVCHPMRGKFFCTENRAKTVTVIVYIFCILTTASTTFEYQLTLNDTLVCSKCQIDSSTTSNHTLNINSSAVHFIPHNVTLSGSHLQIGDPISVINDPQLSDALKNILVNCTTSNHPHIIYVYPQKVNVSKQRSIPHNFTILHHIVDETKLDRPLANDPKGLADVFDNNNNNQTDVNSTSRSCCLTKFYIDVESTSLGKNEDYNTFMYWYSALVFGIIPLVLIAMFNCFLIKAVYVSQKKRKTMTRSNTQTSQTDNSSSVSNENRITMMLIAVVVMFLICQIPTASFLIYYNFYPPQNKRQINIQNILGNVFNSLVTVNASCNFLLYSIISKKFRSTFKQLFFEHGKKKRRQDTIQLSSMKSQNSQKFNPYRHGIGRNASEYRRTATPRNLETTSLTSIPRSNSLMSRPLGKAKSTDLVV